MGDIYSVLVLRICLLSLHIHNNLLCCLYKLQLQRLMFPLGHLPPSTLFLLSLSLFCLNQFLALMHSQSLLAIFPAPS